VDSNLRSLGMQVWEEVVLAPHELRRWGAG
jgi:hypothetical protein